MQKDNEIDIETSGEFAFLHIKGDVTAASEASIARAYRSVDEGGVGKILLQFDPNAYINSGGIAVLIQVLAQSHKKQQQVGITGLSGHFKKIFNMVGITKFAEIYDSADEASQAMSAGA